MAKSDLVILHGWQSNISRWNPLAKILNHYFKVFLPVIPGFGKEKLSRPWKIADYVSWFRDYLSSKKIYKPIIVAHSNGGRIAMAYVSKYRKTNKLILIATPARKTERTLKKMFFLKLAKTGKTFFKKRSLVYLKKPARWFLYTLAGEKDYYRAEGFLKPTMKNLIETDIISYAKHIEVPTLILWGQEDASITLEEAYILQSVIRKSRLVVFKKVGHNLPFTRTKKIASQIIQFCQ